MKAKKDFEQVKKLLKHACEFSSDYNVVHYKDFGNGDHLMSVDMDDIRTIIDFVKL